MDNGNNAAFFRSTLFRYLDLSPLFPTRRRCARSLGSRSRRGQERNRGVPRSCSRPCSGCLGTAVVVVVERGSGTDGKEECRMHAPG